MAVQTLLSNFAQDVPSGWIDVLVLPAILLFSGLFIYFLGWNQERHGKGGAWKWLALLPLLFGVYIGIGEFSKTTDPFFKARLRGERKVFYSHHLALAMPVLGICGLCGWHVASRRTRRPKQQA